MNVCLLSFRVAFFIIHETYFANPIGDTHKAQSKAAATPKPQPAPLHALACTTYVSPLALARPSPRHSIYRQSNQRYLMQVSRQWCWWVLPRVSTRLISPCMLLAGQVQGYVGNRPPLLLVWKGTYMGKQFLKLTHLRQFAVPRLNASTCSPTMHIHKLEVRYEAQSNYMKCPLTELFTRIPLALALKEHASLYV